MLCKKKERCEDKKIKILYIIDTLKQRFGVTAVAMNYFKHINNNDVQIDFLVLPDSEKGIIEEIENRGGKVYFMPYLTFKNLSKFRSFYTEFFKLHNDYKIVHSHFNQIDMFVFPIAKKNGVKHCISHSHNTKYSDYKFRAIRNWVMCLPLKYYADTWAACGIEAGEFLYGKTFLKSDKHMVINNAIDVKQFKFDKEIRTIKRQELGLSNEFVIGNVGSLKLQKNQSYLLSTFCELLKKSKKYKLMIVGDGNLKKELEKQVKDMGITRNVIFLGERNDVHELIQAMDVFILPSLYEGLPVIGVEAQASGIPCLFSSNITSEVNLCNCKFIDLKECKEIWITCVKESEKIVRKNTSKVIIDKGFSIHDEALKLTEFYKTIK